VATCSLVSMSDVSEERAASILRPLATSPYDTSKETVYVAVDVLITLFDRNKSRSFGCEFVDELVKDT
jgi:kynureninase